MERVVVATTKVGIFKQITTAICSPFVANMVVVATTKVGIFKQITTQRRSYTDSAALLLLPQR